jgi:hypothetical protein
VNDLRSASSSEVLHYTYCRQWFWNDGSLVLLDAMSLSWFCGAHGGRALVVEFVGEFFRDMVSYVGSFVTCCIGFQILCALLML